jgi:UDP-N-acetylmuramoyl-tripeptide--D-alanyl-D-alanine ligase
MTPTLTNIAQLCGGRLEGADANWSGVSSDTRTLGKGALFVALRGPNFNGNEFVSAALAAGACGALVDARQPVDLPQIVVQDTQVALEARRQRLARTVRHSGDRCCR